MNKENPTTEQLDIPTALKERLQATGYQYVSQVADLTAAQLQSLCQTNPEETVAFFRQLDFFFDRAWHSAVLCPSLPPICYDLDIDNLVLGEDDQELLEELHQHALHNLSDVSFASREHLQQQAGLSTPHLLKLEFALMSFVDGYRAGDFELLDEEEVPSHLSAEYEAESPEFDVEIANLFRDFKPDEEPDEELNEAILQQFLAEHDDDG